MPRTEKLEVTVECDRCGKKETLNPRRDPVTILKDWWAITSAVGTQPSWFCTPQCGKAYLEGVMLESKFEKAANPDPQLSAAAAGATAIPAGVCV